MSAATADFYVYPPEYQVNYEHTPFPEENKLPESTFENYPDDGSSCLSFVDDKQDNIMKKEKEFKNQNKP